MIRDKEKLKLSSRVVRELDGVRGRVKAAVAAQARSVSLSDALAQIRKFQQLNGTK
jgi:hypothetical protein